MNANRHTDPLASSLSDDDLARLARRALDALPSAPEACIQRAQGLWAARQAPARATVGVLKDALQEALASGLRHIVAVLSFDSALTPPLAQGLRGVDAGGVRHILCSAEGRDIDLRITSSNGRYELAGQILGPDEAGEIELLAAEGPAAHCALDDLGGFAIPGLAAGRYRLRLRAGGDLVELPEIEFGAPGLLA